MKSMSHAWFSSCYRNALKFFQHPEADLGGGQGARAPFWGKHLLAYIGNY